jgi:hypothetical protein
LQQAECGARVEGAAVQEAGCAEVKKLLKWKKLTIHEAPKYKETRMAELLSPKEA